MDFLKDNAVWITPVLVAIVSGVFYLLKKGRILIKQNAKSIKGGMVNQVVGDQHNYGPSYVFQIPKNSSDPNSGRKVKLTIDELKIKTNILFVDDVSFKIVKILKGTEGWINTNYVKDIKSLNDPEIRRADIIFIDINGVGTTLYNDQGMGLAKGIKEKYPQKKVVIYSSERAFNVFSDVWDIVDGRLEKNADPIEFITKVEQFAEDIYNGQVS